jgi:hypothetical protein
MTAEGKRTIRPLNLNTEQIRTAFTDEGCELTTTEYRNSISRLDYTYDGRQYHVQAYAWFAKGSRPHLPRAPVDRSGPHKKKWNRENIAEMFQKEGCEFMPPDDWTYQSNQQGLRYTYQGQEYHTTLNRYPQGGHRPYLFGSKLEIPADVVIAAFKSAGCEITSYDKKSGTIEFKRGENVYSYNKQQLISHGISNILSGRLIS